MDKNSVESLLSLLGLAKKAGMLEVGEDSVGAAAKVHASRLILLASDAAGNTVRRAGHFADAGACLCAQIPATKEELGGALGCSSCAMLALKDIGFAEAAAKKLAALDGEKYGELSARLSVKAARAAQRKAEKPRREKKPGARHK